MATIVQPSDYPAVRAALDTSLDEVALSDDTIELSIFLNAADLQIKARDPGWIARTGDAATHLRNAAIYLTAALLAPAVPAIASEQYADYRYQRQAVDWGARASELRNLAEQELDAYLETNTTTPDRPTMFVAACGRRGRW